MTLGSPETGFMSKLLLPVIAPWPYFSVAGHGQVQCDGTRAVKNSDQKEVQAMSTISIRYMIDDVPAAVEFYTTRLSFTLEINAGPAFAAVSRDGVRLLLSGKASSGRRAMPDGRQPVPGGWNRIQIQVDDLEAMVKRLSDEGMKFRNDIITGPGGSQILLDDPSGNPIELFQPANR
jgi:predicted enzyme related to lactoylglutathione lyase